MSTHELEEYLKVCSEFKLGELSTEKSHPFTKGLSQAAKLNPKAAIDMFKNVDLHMLTILEEKKSEFEILDQSVQNVLSLNGRIFLCGCGATGRLSLALETLWRQEHNGSSQVISFMAGGDVALIKSIEKFEDYPDFGKQQLIDLGFSENDLLIASTEGGETPWVIGACEEAAKLSKHKPFFLFCNEIETLKLTTKRSHDILTNERITPICLAHGPQALSGSTRLQASTILMSFIGLSLFKNDLPFVERVRYLRDHYSFLNLHVLSEFITNEAMAYQRKEFVSYVCDDELGISVLTDTTERSPTFSLAPFENFEDENSKNSWVYLLLSRHRNSESAWNALLGREPRAIEWEETKSQTGKDRLSGYNFSLIGHQSRVKSIGQKTKQFKISNGAGVLFFDFEHLQCFFDCKNFGRLELHIILKMILNMHSTIVMGRLERYESNLMTYVRSSNNKLIDRTIRYAQILLKEKGKDIEYKDLAQRLFELKSQVHVDEPMVLKIIDSYA